MMRLISRISERQSRDDEGFSILELMMALTILMVGIISILGTLVVATKASGLQRHRLNAVQVANSALEKVRSQEYAQIAISPDDPDWAERPVPTSSSATTETVTPVTDTTLSIPVRPDPINHNGVVFEIRRNVTWVPYEETQANPSTTKTYDHAFKHVVVRVTWIDQVGTHDFQVESDVYPGGQGAQNPTSETEFAPLAPSNVDFFYYLTDTSKGLVTWWDNSDNETYFDLQFSIAPFGACNLISDEYWLSTDPPRPENATSYLEISLAPSTPYCWRVRAGNSAGASSWAYSSPVTTPAGSVQCMMLSPSVLSPGDQPSAPQNKIKVNNQGWNVDSILFAVSTSGDCTSIWAEVPTKFGTETVYLSQAGSYWFGQVSSNWARFNLGTLTVSFKGTGLPLNPNPIQQSACTYKTSVC